MASDELGIELVPGDTRPRCTAAVSIAGAAYRCDYAADHDGWAHSSAAANALWSNDVKWGTRDGE